MRTRSSWDGAVKIATQACVFSYLRPIVGKDWVHFMIENMIWNIWSFCDVYTMLSPPFVSVFLCFWCLKPPFQAFQCISWFVLRRNTSFASEFPAVSGDSTKLWAPFPRHWRQSHLHIGGRLPKKDPKSDSVILPWRTRYGFYIIYCIMNHHGIMVDISI